MVVDVMVFVILDFDPVPVYDFMFTMAATCWLFLALVAVHFVSGADNGVWKGDDDRPERHEHHYPQPPLSDQPLLNANTSAPATNLPRSLNVLESGHIQEHHRPREYDNKDDDIVVRHGNNRDGFVNTIVVDGKESDPDYDLIEYESYAGPYYDDWHDHGDERHHESHRRHDDDDDDYDDAEFRRNAHDDLVQHAQAPFNDELDRDRRYSHLPKVNDDDHVDTEFESEPRHRPLGQHVIHDLTNGDDDYDGDEHGNSHDVIALPKFMAPMSHGGNDNAAIVMIGDVTPS